MKRTLILVGALWLLSPVRAQEPAANLPAPPVNPPGPASGTAPTAADPYGIADPFAAGLLSEEAGHDLAAAAAAYRQAIQQFDRQRTDAANAIFRLGEVYRKMGRLEEARVHYARILREFPDMVRLTELSHALLLGEEPAGRRSGPATQPAPMVGGGFGGGMIGGGGGGFSGGMPGATPGMPGATPGTMGGFGGFGGVTAAPAARFSMEDQAGRITCMNRLKQLALATLIYRADHDNRHPPDIVSLSNRIDTPLLLVCPSDSGRQPAASWSEFNPRVHLTYEYTGASVDPADISKPIFTCPIHGNVALGDGSVQTRLQTQPTVTTLALDQQMMRRYGLAAPAAPAAPATPSLPPVPELASELPPVPASDPVMDEQMMQRYGLRPPAAQAPPPSPAAPAAPMAPEVFAMMAKRYGLPAAEQMQHESEERRAEALKAEQEMASIWQQRSQVARELSALEAEAQQARHQLSLADQRREAATLPAERLPAIVNQDPRYQRLKAEYETAVLDDDEEARDRAHTRLMAWVEKIYLPELELERSFAAESYDRVQARREACRARLQELDSQVAARLDPTTGRRVSR